MKISLHLVMIGLLAFYGVMLLSGEEGSTAWNSDVLEMSGIAQDHSMVSLFFRAQALVFERVPHISPVDMDLEALRLCVVVGVSPRTLLSALGQLEPHQAEVVFECEDWQERLQILERHYHEVYESMAAYEAALLFLAAEQYALAERCLVHVLSEFPRAAEAWTLLGLTRLMRYCDELGPVELEKTGISYLAVNAFLQRPASIAGLLIGINERLWWDSVGALREAVRLESNQIVAQAALAMVYLLRPEESDISNAVRFSSGALALLDDSISDPIRGAVLCLAAAVEKAQGEVEAAWEIQAGISLVAPQLEAALQYSTARRLEEKGEEENAATAWLELLSLIPDYSYWHLLARERYENLGGELSIPLSPVPTAVPWDRDLSVWQDWFSLSVFYPVIPRTNLWRYLYSGLQILVTENILLIAMEAEQAGMSLPGLPHGLFDYLEQANWDYHYLLPGGTWRIDREAGLVLKEDGIVILMEPSIRR